MSYKMIPLTVTLFSILTTSSYINYKLNMKIYHYNKDIINNPIIPQI